MDLVAFLLVLVPILVAGGVRSSGRGSVGNALGAAVLFALAAGTTLLALLLSFLLLHAKGPGDGAGLLLLVLGIPVFALLSLVFWILAFSVLGAERAPDDPVRDARVAALKAVLLPVGLLGALAALAAGIVLEARGPGHDGEVRSLEASFGGSEFVSVDEGGTVRRWHAASSRLLSRFRVEQLKGANRPAVHAGPGGSLLVSPDGSRSRYYPSGMSPGCHGRRSWAPRSSYPRVRSRRS